MKEESDAHVERAEQIVSRRLMASPGPGVRPSRAAHLAKYRWKKGQSGSPENKWKKGERGSEKVATATNQRLSRIPGIRYGSGSISKQLALQVSRHGLGQAIARTLAKIAKDPDHALCVRAAEFIAERTEGKVVNQHEHKGVAIARLIVDTSGLTPEEVARIREMETPTNGNGHVQDQR